MGRTFRRITSLNIYKRYSMRISMGSRSLLSFTHWERSELPSKLSIEFWTFISWEVILTRSSPIQSMSTRVWIIFKFLNRFLWLMIKTTKCISKRLLKLSKKLTKTWSTFILILSNSFICSNWRTKVLFKTMWSNKSYKIWSPKRINPIWMSNSGWFRTETSRLPKEKKELVTVWSIFTSFWSMPSFTSSTLTDWESLPVTILNLWASMSPTVVTSKLPSHSSVWLETSI